MFWGIALGTVWIIVDAPISESGVAIASIIIGSTLIGESVKELGE